MRISKSKKYAIEQFLIQKQIISLLNLENGFYLYELDRDQDKQEEIMGMVPEIWKFFAHMNVTGLLYPEKCKRPWLSIVRGVLKNRYQLKYKACRYSTKNGSVFTMKYYIKKIDDSDSSSSMSSISNSSEASLMTTSASSDSLSDLRASDSSITSEGSKISLKLKKKITKSKIELNLRIKQKTKKTKNKETKSFEQRIKKKIVQTKN